MRMSWQMPMWKSLRVRRVMVRGAVVAALGAVSLVLPEHAFAQGRGRFWHRLQARQEQQNDHGKGNGKGNGNGKNKTPHRAALEEAYRVRAESLVRTRLNLNDEQMTKLRVVNSRLGARRRNLFQQERSTRAALRAEVARGKGADQRHVDQLMTQAQELQQQRMELQAQERKEVSQFLSPVQQAQYFGFQARLRKRAQELEEGGGQ